MWQRERAGSANIRLVRAEWDSPGNLLAVCLVPHSVQLEFLTRRERQRCLAVIAEESDAVIDPELVP